jgi:hypothetical protein
MSRLIQVGAEGRADRHEQQKGGDGPDAEGLSGTNPNNQDGHGEGSTQGVTDHQSECRQQVCLGLHLVSRHTVAPSSPGPIGRVDVYG